ncbi:SDR family NAD(P)-dependent oxidoreductase [Minwuia thermotolerans]|uniref:3-beta hydroxysteroid dehydrogenase n=1 Tax=Minwuia thermotolerans TaxID=2056226 RepID=A0A2M9G1C8_9PROT|nr:glucose 1-dehydrogenase [Minwuia thermotolerans]PJK29515.1 3-beta hydroxysteroid dehydrogenase [Minwuia thermotolerans]
MGRLDGKVIWITGAASGLGRESALRCAAEGARLVVTDLAAPDTVAAEIADAGGGVLALAQDVTVEGRWDEVADEAEEAFGGFDVLVNNAGLGENRPLAETTLTQWRRVQSVNLDSVFLGTRLAFRRMRPGGSVINISSILGLVGNAGTAAYCASKGGVRLLSKSAAVEAAQAGLTIRVNSIHPGYIETPMVVNAVNKRPEPDQVMAYIASRHPVGHLGEPADIAHAVVYLASDESRFVTGAEMVVDGGYTAW